MKVSQIVGARKRLIEPVGYLTAKFSADAKARVTQVNLKDLVFASNRSIIQNRTSNNSQTCQYLLD